MSTEEAERSTIISHKEAVENYKKTLGPSIEQRLDINKWIPLKVAPLKPSDMVVILGSTGVGKTFLAQMFGGSNTLPTLFFQLEIAQEMQTQRALAMENNISEYEVEQRVLKGIDLKDNGMFSNMYYCDLPRATPDLISNECLQFEKKYGFPVKVVMIDYLQLLSYTGNRYEAMSSWPEKLRRIARQRNLIIVLLSQMGREASKRETGPELFDAKESGSVENSASLVVSISRPVEKKEDSFYSHNAEEEDFGREPEHQDHILEVKVLKCSRGYPGYKTRVKIDWQTMSLKEV